MPPDNATSPPPRDPPELYPIYPLLQPGGPDTPYPFQETLQDGQGLPSTRLAHIYGVGGPPHYKNTGRSGFTPVALPPESAYPISRQSIKEFSDINQFQRDSVRYTTLELDNLGALRKPDVKPNNLTNAIHPIFEKHHWQQQGTIPVNLPGIHGFYDVNNPPVWEALLPCLRLSTMFLSNLHWWGWWDALIYGERRIMPIPPRNPLYPRQSETFHLRPVEEMMAAARTGAVKRFINKLSDSGHYFEIETGHVLSPNPTTGFVPIVCVQGMNILLHLDQRVSKTTLSWQVIEPLLRTGPGALGPNQRLAQQFQIAKTMLHELCHQVGRHTEETISTWEPHFEDESVAELGRSMERAIFGFISYGASPPYSQTKTKPFITNLFATWPSHEDHLRNHRRGATLNPPELTPGFRLEWWAVPVSYFEALQQADFWTHIVSCFGRSAIQPYPKIQGMLYRFVGEGMHDEFSEVVGPDFNTWRNVAAGMHDLELEVWLDHNGNGTARERVWRREQVLQARYRAAVVARSKRLEVIWFGVLNQMRATVAAEAAALQPLPPPGPLDPSQVDPALFH